jgi:hypothetical protein
MLRSPLGGPVTESLSGTTVGVGENPGTVGAGSGVKKSLSFTQFYSVLLSFTQFWSDKI